MGKQTMPRAGSGREEKIWYFKNEAAQDVMIVLDLVDTYMLNAGCRDYTGDVRVTISSGDATA